MIRFRQSPMSFFAFMVGVALALTLVGCGERRNAETNERTDKEAIYQMAVLGDSVASGMFADTTLGKELRAVDREHLVELYRISEELKPDTEEFYLAAQATAAAPDASAFSGTAAYALAPRIELLRNERVGIQRYAVSGSTAGSMDRQTEILAEDVATGKRKASVVVIHIGANDFCDLTSPTDFRVAVAARLREVTAVLPDARMLITKIPDLPHILTLPDRAAFSVGGVEQTCSQVRRTMGLCSQRTLAPGAPAVEVAKARADVAALNDVLTDEVAKLTIERTVAGHANVTAMAAYDVSGFDASSMALDCFHPGTAGHAAIAEAVWPALAVLVERK